MPIRTSAAVVGGASVATLQAAPTAITIHTSGATFTPVLTLTDPTAVVTWTLPDGTVSHATTLNVTWGTSAARATTLLVTPWSALGRLNLGYDRGDGGSVDIELVASCAVTAIDGLALVAPTLGQLCVSNSPITELDLTGFTNLDTVEAYLSNLRYVTLRRTHKLARICFEGNDLEFLDLSECPAGADVRCAINNGHLRGIEFGSCLGNWWHICCQTNFEFTKELPPPREHPLLRDWYTWSCQQHGDANGHLDFNTGVASHLINVAGAGNYYRTADLTNRFVEGNPGGSLDLSNNLLTAVTLTGCTNLTRCLLNGNLLTEAQVDAVLAQLVTGAKTGGTVALEDGNAEPSGAGVASANTLISRGWTVSYTGQAILESIAVTPASASIVAAATRQYTATGTYDDESTADLTALVTWDSGNDAYVTISAGGLATGVAAGATSITATLGAIVGTTPVTCTAAPVIAVTFTSTAQTIQPACLATGSTATWHYGDGTTDTGFTPAAHDFGAPGAQTSTLTVTNPAHLTNFGSNSNMGILTLSGLSDFPALYELRLYATTGLTSVDVAGCAALTSVLCAYTALDATACDNLCIDLDAAVPAGSNGTLLLPNRYTAASDAARASLVTKGWTIGNG